MLQCSGLCEYYETYETFAKSRTYETHKRCTRCDHVVEKAEFPDVNCYCCGARYRNTFPQAREHNRQKRNKKAAVRRRKAKLLISQ